MINSNCHTSDTIPHLPGTKDEPHDSSIPNNADKIYLMTNKVIRYNGTMVAWDYEADADTGIVYFQVYQARKQNHNILISSFLQIHNYNI